MSDEPILELSRHNKGFNKMQAFPRRIIIRSYWSFWRFWVEYDIVGTWVLRIRRSVFIIRVGLTVIRFQWCSFQFLFKESVNELFLLLLCAMFWFDVQVLPVPEEIVRACLMMLIIDRFFSSGIFYESKLEERKCAKFQNFYAQNTKQFLVFFADNDLFW